MQGLSLLNQMLYTVLLSIGLLIGLRALFWHGWRGCDYSSYKQRIEELKEQLRETREHYEQLLRDAAVKSEMMRSLWAAWRSGKLAECYTKNGEARVLADGTVLCEMPDKSKSYVISVEEVVKA